MVHSYFDLKVEAEGKGTKKPDACAILYTHIFSSYSDYLGDLSDLIIGSMNDEMTKKISDSEVVYQEQKQ